jgi:hypothetical protein
MKTKLILTGLALLSLSSCATSYTNKPKGIAMHNAIGVDMTKMVQTPDGTYYQDFVSSKAFKDFAKSVTTMYGIGALASVTKNADKLDAQSSMANSAAGVSNTKTAAGVAVNASNNATAVEALKVKGATAIGILKNTPAP